MAENRAHIEAVKRTTTELRLDLTKLDWNAYLTMVGLNVGMDVKIGDVKAALRELIAEKSA
jgi:hypothetical protein